MPREQQKRGRRAEKKAQKDDSKRKFEETAEDPVAKRMKPSADDADEINEVNDDVQLPENEDYIPLDQGEQQEGEQPNLDGDMPFYGLLDEEESEYFQRANEMLELNQFQDAEERSLFVDSVYSEASGKELKIACSQGCSRLMEKLISMSNTQQLRRIFSKFIGHFLHLVQHRFASHCCETLFIHAAPAVMQKAKPQPKQSDGDEEGEEEPELSLAEMFMAVIEELKENWGYLLTERFASHTIRVLLLVLAGEPVDVTSNESFVASRKKERIEIKAIQGEEKMEKSNEKHTVPATFEPALKKIMTDMVAGLDDVYLRALATHPVGNPVLQVLLFLELSHFGKSSAKDPKSTIRRLVPDDSFEEESESAVFIRGLLYDPVGSRLLETMVRYLPGKSFKNLYRNNLGDRIGSLARNSTAGYVVLRMLERLGKDDLKIAMANIIPEIPGLIERSRLIVPKMLIERCVVRGVDTKPLAEALEGAYSQDPVIRLQQMLKFNPSDNTAPQSEDHDMDEDNNGKERKPRGPPPVSAAEKAEKLHASLLVQAMLTVPGPMSQLVYTSLLAQSPESIVQLAQEPTSSRVLQQALTSQTSTPQIRRQLTTRFQGNLTPLALSSSGSHVVDALWHATKDIFFVKERMAQELEQHEQELRDSFVGRAVWRNWSMDLFKRRRRDWAHKAKGLEERTESNEGAARPMSKLDQARARYAAAKEAADAGATGANQTAVSSRQ
ncbi:Armadillo-like helical [Penicillium coprophilum]|uniref:Armadillo-like helical n=1 Tax=Penicillium coprophilum TaxID=36646 RepID=UPI00238E5839|nr:Armadillo-like helical [Penicillium coprophilum]KAJ5158569.1 Armadillo-like helical [Penicillium coprophilum]